MLKINFDEKEHKYFINDKEFPSVTTILHAQNFIDDTWFTDEARERGKNIHTATQYLDEGDLDFDSIVPEYRPYLEAYEKFLEDYKPSWKLIEFKIADLLYGYAGTLDRLGLSEALNKYILVDIKSGAENKATGLQISAYEHALYHMQEIKQFEEINNLPDLKNMKIVRYGLYLKKDSTYKMVKYTNKEEIKIFRSATSCHQWQRNNL